MKHYQILEKINGTKTTVGLIPIIIDANENTCDYFIESTYKDLSGKNNPCYKVTLDGVKLLLDNMRNYKKKNDLYEWYNKRTNKGDKIILVDREETDFISSLEDALIPFGIVGVKQFCVLSYRIDFYIPKLNIAIEYDESDHILYTYEQHEGREKIIKDELKCDFIRLSNKNNNSYNVGVVLKEIMNYIYIKSA